MMPSQGPRISLPIKANITWMTGFLKVIFCTHSMVIPKKQRICSRTSKCNYLLAVYHVSLSLVENKQKNHFRAPPSTQAYMPVIHSHTQPGKVIVPQRLRAKLWYCTNRAHLLLWFALLQTCR